MAEANNWDITDGKLYLAAICCGSPLHDHCRFVGGQRGSPRRLRLNAGRERGGGQRQPPDHTTTVGNSGAKDRYADMDPEPEMDFFRKLAGRG